MYNKIASIILNSAKAEGLSDVFVAQPDSLKENLAGKTFLLAEMPGKKAEGRKIFDFLVKALNDNYYNDEKILFRGKIEGLKIENIFEAAVTKTNKNLAEWLASEKIKINPTATNITLGVIYENKLYFATFGRNRALLVYRHGDDYEIINVEANAEEVMNEAVEAENAGPQTPKLFSSVISGEVPPNSYFIFTSEALPEYLSGQDLIRIVTKLPPIAAAEQIKNVLAKINTYVPFLGIIIKNTVGASGQETKEEVEENSSAYSSISSLNYTEQKTEQMLAPAGLINLSKITKAVQQSVRRWFAGPAQLGKKYLRPSEQSADKEVQPSLDLGTVKSLNLARSDSFLLKEKIFFKKKSSWLGVALKNLVLGALDLFNPQRWADWWTNLKLWLASLNQKNRWLFITLSLLVVIFIGSILYTNWSHQRQVAQTNFDNLVATIENQESAVDAHLLYDDQAGAKTALIAAQAALSSLPQKTPEQRAVYARLAASLSLNEEKIEKIVRVSAAVKANDLAGLTVDNLVYLGGKIYGAGGSTIYKLTPSASTYTKITAAGASNLASPVVAGANLYYADGNQIIQYAPASGVSHILKISSLDPATSLAGFSIYGSNQSLYAVAPSKNQIYRYSKSASGFGVKTDWLQDTADLSLGTSLGIDGNIYVLENNGQVLKFYKNKAAAFSSTPLTPVTAAASKLLVGQKYLYIFDASAKRLAVLDKTNGTLLNQYIVNSLVKPQDVAIDETGKTAYFLDSGAIYKIALNQ
jgi:serine/threonine protein phosphatase PrpC